MTAMRSHSRLAALSALGALLGLIGGGAAWLLVHLIGLVTSLALFHQWSWEAPSFSELDRSPLIPLTAMAGALGVTLLARWAPAIRGHGIPETMEAVLERQSRIAPRVAVAKPISAAAGHRHRGTLRRRGTDHRDRWRSRLAPRAALPGLAVRAEDPARQRSRSRHGGDLRRADGRGGARRRAAAVRVLHPSAAPARPRRLGGRRDAPGAVRGRSALLGADPGLPRALDPPGLRPARPRLRAGRLRDRPGPLPLRGRLPTAPGRRALAPRHRGRRLRPGRAGRAPCPRCRLRRDRRRPPGPHGAHRRGRARGGEAAGLVDRPRLGHLRRHARADPADQRRVRQPLRRRGRAPGPRPRCLGHRVRPRGDGRGVRLGHPGQLHRHRVRVRADPGLRGGRPAHGRLRARVRRHHRPHVREPHDREAGATRPAGGQPLRGRRPHHGVRAPDHERAGADGVRRHERRRSPGDHPRRRAQRLSGRRRARRDPRDGVEGRSARARRGRAGPDRRPCEPRRRRHPALRARLATPST